MNTQTHILSHKNLDLYLFLFYDVYSYIICIAKTSGIVHLLFCSVRYNRVHCSTTDMTNMVHQPISIRFALFRDFQRMEKFGEIHQLTFRANYSRLRMNFVHSLKFNCSIAFSKLQSKIRHFPVFFRIHKFTIFYSRRSTISHYLLKAFHV